MERPRSRKVAVVSIYAALYASITLVEAFATGPLAFGPVQVRISDALLPTCAATGPPAAMGLALGCVVANALTTGSPIDVVLGSIANLLAGYASWRLRRRHVLIPALASAFIVTAIVASYLPLLFNVPWPLSYVGVLGGELIACVVIGAPLTKKLQGALGPNLSRWAARG